MARADVATAHALKTAAEPSALEATTVGANAAPGSGTTIIAAEITGRSCHAIEIDPSYIDVAVERWQAFTGDTARMEADGRTFVAVAAERRPDSQRPPVGQRSPNKKRK